MRRGRPASVLLLVLVLLVSGCDHGDSSSGLSLPRPVGTPTSSSSHVIGLVGTLSGAGSWRGEVAFEGASLGVARLNRGGGDFALVTLDDKGNPARAAGQVRRLAQDASTVGIVYAGPEAAVGRARASLRAAGIPMIVCYGDLDRGPPGPLFQASPPVRAEAKSLIAYGLRDRGFSRLGLLASRAPEGAAAVTAATAVGPPALVVARYRNGSSQRRALIRLRRAHVEAVIVEGAPEASAAAIRRLAAMHAAYRDRVAAVTEVRRHSWHPQVLGFDNLITRQVSEVARPGTVAADSFGRAAFYLPVPQMVRYERWFKLWWDEVPLGRERRAFDAVSAIGWAWRRKSGGRGSVGATLRRLHGDFSGSPIDLTKTGRRFVPGSQVGLFTVPAKTDDYAGRLPEGLGWVLLSRGFARGRRTDLPASTWPYLFSHRALSGPRPPRYGALRYGIATPRRDPLH